MLICHGLRPMESFYLDILMHICDLCAPHIWGRGTSECHVALVFNTNFFMLPM